MLKHILFVVGLAVFVVCAQQTSACRIGSERLVNDTRLTIKRLLRPDLLQSVYWADEPLDAAALGSAMGMNIELVTTSFELANVNGTQSEASSKSEFLREVFVGCRIDRSHAQTLLVNIEMLNPFQVIDVRFESMQDEDSAPGHFRIHLANSTFLVQLLQRVSYDECVNVNYVQLAPNSSYEIECLECSKQQEDIFNKILQKRLPQMDTELDKLLSEKILLGLEVLLSQERFEFTHHK